MQAPKKQMDLENTKPIEVFGDEVSSSRATMQVVDERSEGQRIDNYLCKLLKGVPKSHVYRILRSGEIRVNKKRVNSDARVQLGDVVRIPPIRVAEMAPTPKPNVLANVKSKLADHVIFEDDAMLALNKPSGMAVHGGSGISLGVIEQLRLERPQAKLLELVHRLDRETSGVLMVAKKRSALTALHDAIRHHRVDKSYLILVKGHWTEAKKKVVLDLQKYLTAEGERRVSVVNAVPDYVQANINKSLQKKDAQRKAPVKHEVETQSSETIFYLKAHVGDYSLLQARLITGRTHQLRVQLAHLGFPILGDDKYGDFALNKALAKSGLKRMFLHSSETKLKHPLTQELVHLIAPLSVELVQFLRSQGYTEI